ncbi:hypothetical protein HRG_001106 [Hirsutella rhossiliensis]|uniref:Uncharacterized protein n=1 Tax=Hirsutella rhossiliensis TaxID=111463 RepID=A0A9P8SNJ4_9HYPO|nr:uncharacterized protein HRG_01106 [Hirsutella rhossiliensis]KAH0968464.1 hypothetical protein HRG_01106 [Hirsutella rhossiliensis]
MIDIATRHLTQLDAFSGYATVVAGLVQGSSFEHESDDLVIHRCLLASHALAEVYIRALQGGLPAADYANVGTSARYPKGNVKQAVVRTAGGPILGHHQIMTLNCATCFDIGMPPRLAFLSYKENMCWFNDWATAHREDGDVLAAVNACMTLERCADDSETHAGQELSWRARNEVGDQLSRWLAQLDVDGKESSNSSLAHTGVLCALNDGLRRVLVASVCYGSYHFWPTPRQMTADDYASYLCASIGGMARGWAIDHDSEAAIGEHNLFNWLCRGCSVAVTREVLFPASAAAPREDANMRIAWGAQTYFYFGQRHHGFARRVDNLAQGHGTCSHGHMPTRAIRPSCSPVAAGDGVGVIVTKLLALCGVEPARGCSDVDDFGEAEWDCDSQMCPMCQFDGSRAQLFMVSVGAARLAIKLPSEYRMSLVNLMDTFGFRLFPAIQARLLVLCPCLPKWAASVMSHGYAEAGTRCGQSDCSAPVHEQGFFTRPLADEEVRYGNTSLRELLLRQARVEATDYANKTGQAAWLNVVSQPLKA